MIRGRRHRYTISYHGLLRHGGESGEPPNVTPTQSEMCGHLKARGRISVVPLPPEYLASTQHLTFSSL